MIKRIGPEMAEYIAANQLMYPEAMREDVETFRVLLANPFCLGYFGVSPALPTRCIDALSGWILFKKESFKQEYCYDLAVLPDTQRCGIGRMLWIHACRELRWYGKRIHAHCRRQSYELLTCHAIGYELVRDKFIENHYAKEYESDDLIGEHAHEIWLKPVGM